MPPEMTRYQELGLLLFCVTALIAVLKYSIGRERDRW